MSSQPRLYVMADLRNGQPFSLDQEASKYLLRVMRLSEGAEVRVFNGRHGEWLAKLSRVDGRVAELLPVEQMRIQPERQSAHLTLLFAPVKKAETDFIVEKATELGAHTLQPVITDYTQSRTVRTDRFAKIALEAAEQTERLDLPEIADALPLNRALDGLAPDCALIFCDEAGNDATRPWGGEEGRAQAALKTFCMLTGRAAAVLIGPEGGFSSQERAFLRSRADTYPVSLGPRILRAETAAVSALTLWQAACGDWQ